MMIKIKNILIKSIIPMTLFCMGYILAMFYEVNHGNGFYSQKDDIRFRINEEKKEIIENGCLFVDSLDGYFFTSRANGSARAIINQNIELDSFCLSPTDALIIAKTALWQFYDINDIEACNPYTISEDDSTYYVRGSLEHLPNHLTGKSHYSREELKEVSSIIRNREIYNVRIRKHDAKIIFLGMEI